MELEFRKKDGVYIFSIFGKEAKQIHSFFQDAPELNKTVVKLNNADKEVKVFKCIEEYHLKMNLGNRMGFQFMLLQGDYIKII